MLKYISAGVLLASPLLIAGIVCLAVWLAKRGGEKKLTTLMVVWVACFVLFVLFQAFMVIGGYLAESEDDNRQVENSDASSGLAESCSISDMTAYYPSSWLVVNGEGTNTVTLSSTNGSLAQFSASKVSESNQTSASDDDILSVALMGVESQSTVLGEPSDITSNGSHGVIASMVMEEQGTRFIGYVTLYVKDGTLYQVMVAYPEGAEDDMEAVHKIATSVKIS